MNKIQITIDEPMLETLGSFTLMGKVSQALLEMEPNRVQFIELLFPETDMNYRRKNGPRDLLIKEYTISCLLKDVLKLEQMGYVVEIINVPWVP